MRGDRAAGEMIRLTSRERTAMLPAIRWLFALMLLAAPTVAIAGPPFLTDDPEPTGTGHWEIYGPLFEGEGREVDSEGSTGVELNYGPVPNLQLTLGLPVAFAHDRDGTTWGTGDAAVSAKYRLYHDKKTGLSIAAFPGLTLSTATHDLGAGRVTGFLPVWIQKDSGTWSVFGGGGYAINPGSGNHDFWTGGIAVSHEFSQSLLIGLEADRSGADTIDGHGSTSLGLGSIYQLKAPFRLLASGGPTFEDGGGPAGFHFFAALGLDL